MVWMIFLWFFDLCLYAQQLLGGYYSTYTEFLARNGQIWPAQLPPTAFSDQCQSVSKKIKTKRKRMMGWIKNGPKRKLSWFFVRQHLPAKTKSFPFRFISLKYPTRYHGLCHSPPHMKLSDMKLAGNLQWGKNLLSFGALDISVTMV